MDDLDWAAITGEPSAGLLLGSPQEDESLRLPAIKPKYWWQEGYVSDADDGVGKCLLVLWLLMHADTNRLSSKHF